jgi:hypothetical protein
MSDPSDDTTDAIRQLHRSGWSIGDTSFATPAGGMARVLTGTNGENIIRAGERRAPRQGVRRSLGPGGRGYSCPAFRARLLGYDPQGMNHPREEHQQAKQDVDEKILAEAPFQNDGDRRQENGDQDQGQLVHDS